MDMFSSLLGLVQGYNKANNAYQYQYNIRDKYIKYGYGSLTEKEKTDSFFDDIIYFRVKEVGYSGLSPDQKDIYNTGDTGTMSEMSKSQPLKKTGKYIDIALQAVKDTQNKKTVQPVKQVEPVTTIENKNFLDQLTNTIYKLIF